MAIYLVAAPYVPDVAVATYAPWDGGPVAPERAVRALHGVTLAEAAPERTESLLIRTLGLRQTGEAAGMARYDAGAGGASRQVEVARVDATRGSVAVGTVHHIAWRTPDDPTQGDWRRTLLERGYNVTPVMDRTYFHSIYFREPGGVLFEIATDAPGFAVDEPPEALGRALRLPPWLEQHRALIEQSLPPVRLPGA
jgi:glyoxalase family protein